MSSFKQLWRPGAFSAVGEGFKKDAALNDGIHLRWTFDHRLGLPFERRDVQQGGFRVYQQISQPRTVLDMDLLTMPLGGVFPIRSKSTPQPGSQIHIAGDQISFQKQTNQSYLQLLWNARVRLRFLRQFFFNMPAEQREFVGYIESVVNRLYPRMGRTSAVWETSEACAVDLRYKSIGTKPPNPNIDDPYVRVKGVDRNGRVVVEDWIGFRAGGGSKAAAKLRAAGIAYVLAETVPGKTAPAIDEVRWMLCEDYCQAFVWPRETPFGARFNAEPGFHTPDVTKNQHYAPFANPADPDRASDIISGRFVGDADVQAMLAEPSTWKAAQWKVHHEGGGDETSLALSMLQSLVGTAIDPLMAKILGLYFYAQEPASALFAGGDIKIEASFPFFLDANLDRLETELKALAPNFNLRFLLDNARTLAGTSLCGLVLGPRIDEKPRPVMPEEFDTRVSATDIPSQIKPGRVDLLVDATIEARAAVNDLRPYAMPAGYFVERDRDGKGFEDVIAAEDTERDDFDQIRMMPPLYMPRKKRGEWTDQLVVKDNFTTVAAGTSTVQYRLTAYDLFGRSSKPVEGKSELIVPPCRRPSEPANLAARIVTEGNFLVLDMTFSLDSAIQALEAVWQSLEVTVHRLPLGQAGPATDVAQTKWTGSLPGRKLDVTATPDHDLSFPPIANSCVSLSWSGDSLVRASAPETVCSAEFPAANAVLEPIDPPAMPFEETGLRSFRLRVPVGRLTTLEPDVYRWCGRLRVKGRNPETGETLYSAEPCVAAERVIPPPPPQPSRPITAGIPSATFPDTLGDSYFTLDLNEFQPLATGQMVNVYLTTLDRLTETPETLVDGDRLLDVAAFRDLARSSRRPFELLTQQPLEYKPATRFYPIKVRGDLRQYHVAAVVGCNPYLQEQPWTNASIIPFTTPEPLVAPKLRYEEARPYVNKGLPTVALTFSVPVSGSLANAPQPPKIQVLRRDLSSGRNALAFVADPAGVMETTGDGESVYRFRCIDETIADWRRYEYQATLLVYAASAGQHLKSGDAAVCTVGAQWGGVRKALDESDTITAEPPAPEWQDVTVEFASGEFDFSLTKVHEAAQVSRIEGQLRGGSLAVTNGAAEGSRLHVLESGRRYKLMLRDPNPGDGEYTFRLSFGQSITWSKKGK